MTHLTTTLGDRYPSCPGCGAVAWPQWLTSHRPTCPYIATDPAHWPTSRTETP